MSPIPINASTGMLISLAVALVLTPWMSNKLLAHAPLHSAAVEHDSGVHKLFSRLMTPFIGGDRGKRARALLYGGLTAVIGVALLLVVLQFVVLKMLPFDNKSELQIVVDMPEGTTVETTARVLDELGSVVETLPETTDYQAYAGTAAPINFNGLVRQYYLREGSNVGDLQVNLVDRHNRERASHDIARDLRERIRGIGVELGASIKVVEVPPGPPVLAPIVAELYGPDYALQRDLARRLTTLFSVTDDIVDIDSTVEAEAERYIIDVDRQRAALLGVSH
jgi:multidrug efflux pump subunit AcrB